MKTIEIGEKTPSLERLLAHAQEQDIVLLRRGHAIVRIERFTDEDWDDWLFEHDPKNIREGREQEESIRRGEHKSLEQVEQELGLKRRRRKKTPLGNQ